MRTAAYCRFSSDAQRETSIRDQVRNIETFCARLGWSNPVLYQDQAVSGARNDRIGYQSLIAAAEAGAFDVLLVDDLIATGGTMMAGKKLLEKLGGVVVEGAAIVDLPELGGSQRLREGGLDVFTFVRFSGH